MRKDLDSVRSRQGIKENSERRRFEGQYNKRKCRCREDHDGQPWGATAYFFTPKLACFVNIRCGGGDKENRDIDKIGGSTDDAVIGIKKEGNQSKTQQNSTELDAPKILTVTKEKAL